MADMQRLEIASHSVLRNDVIERVSRSKLRGTSAPFHISFIFLACITILYNKDLRSYRIASLFLFRFRIKGG